MSFSAHLSCWPSHSMWSQCCFVASEGQRGNFVRLMMIRCVQAANYLNIKSLLDLTCLTVANMIKGAPRRTSSLLPFPECACSAAQYLAALLNDQASAA